MENQIIDISLRKAAIVAGTAILVMAAAAIFATDVVLSRLIVPGDAAATTDNIRTSEILFRAGIFSWLVVLICDVLAAWGLYVFLKPVNRSLSLLMAWLRLVYAAILGTALLNFIIVLLLVGGDSYLPVLGTDQLQAQVLLFLNAFNDMWSIGLAVFGFHILVLAYLVFKSGYVPKIFGILLFIAFWGYLITYVANLLLPDYENYKTIIELIFIIPMIVGEVGLAVWLLFRGVKVQQVP
jgi:hypothetical protein